jgi:hypothetical protein
VRWRQASHITVVLSKAALSGPSVCLRARAPCTLRVSYLRPDRAKRAAKLQAVAFWCPWLRHTSFVFESSNTRKILFFKKLTFPQRLHNRSLISGSVCVCLSRNHSWLHWVALCRCNFVPRMIQASSPTPTARPYFPYICVPHCQRKLKYYSSSYCHRFSTERVCEQVYILENTLVQMSEY